MVRIFWELVISTFGIGIGFFIGERLLRKIGIGDDTQKVVLSVEEIPEYLKSKFLVNSALFYGEKKKILGVEETEALEMRKLIEKMNAEELVVFKDNDCRYGLKQGKVFLYVRGKIASFRDLSEIWEVLRRSLRGVGR